MHVGALSAFLDAGFRVAHVPSLRRAIVRYDHWGEPWSWLRTAVEGYLRGASSSSCRSDSLGGEAERGVAVRDHDERVSDHPVLPAHDALHEIEQAPWIFTGEQDCEPRDHDRDESREVQE